MQQQTTTTKFEKNRLKSYEGGAVTNALDAGAVENGNKKTKNENEKQKRKKRNNEIMKKKSPIFCFVLRFIACKNRSINPHLNRYFLP
jgi:hypothetical protein